MPQAQQLLFERRGGLAMGGAWGDGIRRLGQGLQIDLAGGGHGQRWQQAEAAGHHVVGQALTQQMAQHIDAQIRRGRHPGVQARRAAISGLVLGDMGLADTGHGDAGGLDIAGLDAVAAQLDLPVGPTAEMQQALRVEPAAVTAAVHHRVGHEGVGDEALLRQLGPVQIAACQGAAADVDLARHEERLRAQRLVEHVDARVVQNAAQRQRRGFGADRWGAATDAGPGGAKNRRLGRAVDVIEPRAGFVDEAPCQFGRQHLAAAAGHAQLQRQCVFRFVAQAVQDARHRGWHQRAERRPVAADEVGQPVGMQTARRRDGDAGALGQRQQQFDQRRVERCLRRLRGAVV